MAIRNFDSKATTPVSKEFIDKETKKIEGLLNVEMKIENDDIQMALSYKKLGETVVKVRGGIAVIYGLSMSIKRAEDSLKDTFQSKSIKYGAVLFNTEFTKMIQIANQVNELTKILPEEFKLSTEDAGEWRSLIADHKKLINLLKIYTEYNNVTDVNYSKTLSQYVGDNIVKYSKMIQKEDIDEQNLIQFNKKITLVINAVLEEYVKLYKNSEITIKAFVELKEKNIRYIDICAKIDTIITEVEESKKSIAGQLEYVTKHLVAINQITELEKDVKKNVPICKQIIDKEMYELEEVGIGSGPMRKIA